MVKDPNDKARTRETKNDATENKTEKSRQPASERDKKLTEQELLNISGSPTERHRGLGTKTEITGNDYDGQLS